MTTAPASPEARPARTRREPTWRTNGPSVAGVVGFGFAVVGFLLGIRSIGDNSLFTHIATGRLILEQGSIPSTDPYSFTAAGEPWIVQSWLADLLYGVADRLAGGNGVRILGGLLVGALMALVWRLTRPAATLAPRLLVTAMTLLVGLAFFAPRPLVFGLVLLALTLVIVDEDRDPRWLVPILWLWVNVHGSFPLALVALGCLALGARFDGDRTRAPWRPLLWAGLGVALGAINPLGPKLLLFPVDLLGRMEILRNVVEWRSPDFTTSYARFFLAEVVVAVLVLVRRPSYRVAVPLAVFVAAAMLGARNIPIAAIVMVPGLAIGMGGVGRLDGRERGPVPTVLAAVIAVAGLVVSVSSLARPAYDLGSYPLAGIDWLDERGAFAPDGRVATTDVIGNLLELRYGADASVFFDDRYDMYPAAVSRDYVSLNRGATDWDQILDRYGVEHLLWPRKTPLEALVRGSDRWSISYQDDDVIVACRRGVAADC